LLKHQIPIRTFANWDDAAPAFVEADLVAHCGDGTYGTDLSTLILTDVATGWVECHALLFHSTDQVVQGVARAHQLIPFPLCGVDTDNSGVFITNDLLEYCTREQITFTRGRLHRKNDQCYVEQKNGSIVRQFVGYDRYEGELAYRQLIELYRALRLYVNSFQPSLKLKEKQRDGIHTRRTYLPTKTPFERLCMTNVLTIEARAPLDAIFTALDPVRLLHQSGHLQEALWSHVRVAREESVSTSTKVPFRLDPTTSDSLPSPVPIHRQKRAYHHKHPERPQWWRTRLDPCAGVWGTVEAWLEAQPDLTGVAVFKRLPKEYCQERWYMS
jgi:hypothetical protein